MQELSGLDARHYDMCPESCMCYAGPYASLQKCTYCGADRYRLRGGKRSPAKQFKYIPLIPQIKALYAGRESAAAMRYRSEHQDDNTNNLAGVIDDIYDAAHYRMLRQTPVVVHGHRLPCDALVCGLVRQSRREEQLVALRGR